LFHLGLAKGGTVFRKHGVKARLCFKKRLRFSFGCAQQVISCNPIQPRAKSALAPKSFQRADDLNQNLMREWPQIPETKLQQHVSCDYLRLTLRTQLFFVSDLRAIAKMVDNDLPVALPNRYFRAIDQNCVTGNRLYVGHRNDKGLVYPQKAVNLHQRFHRRDF
jgi:hypothetical protein